MAENGANDKALPASADGIVERDSLTWGEDGHPRSTRFDDGFHAAADGLGEARSVFLSGNGLPHRWQPGAIFTIAELGFGTGLSFLATWQAWQRAGLRDAHLVFISFEQFPLSRADLERATDAWPELHELAHRLCADWPDTSQDFSLSLDGVTLQVIVGDARTRVAGWSGAAGAWYLDGFSPAKNPELWDNNLLAEVYAHTHPGGTFSTYTAAGWVRRNLEAAGFTVQRVPGYGEKRERLQGQRT